MTGNFATVGLVPGLAASWIRFAFEEPYQFRVRKADQDMLRRGCTVYAGIQDSARTPPETRGTVAVFYQVVRGWFSGWVPVGIAVGNAEGS
jgi:hypothetical protein